MKRYVLVDDTGSLLEHPTTGITWVMPLEEAQKQKEYFYSRWGLCYSIEEREE